MLEFFYTLLRLPLPEWTDEFSVALLATDPSRVQDAWKLQEGYVAAEGKCLLPHISKFRPNLVLNHMALLIYCLVEARLVQTLVEVIITSDTFISVRSTILLGMLSHNIININYIIIKL
jgi:rapamycin-insensitive companion of mTOR